MATGRRWASSYRDERALRAAYLRSRAAFWRASAIVLGRFQIDLRPCSDDLIPPKTKFEFQFARAGARPEATAEPIRAAGPSETKRNESEQKTKRKRNQKRT